MSYNYPYQNYNPAAFPPPPPPWQSSTPSYAPTQKPALPPRQPPTPGSPNVQDLTAGFARLSTHSPAPTQQSYVPHAEYHQATSNFTWPTTHGDSLSGAPEYEPPPPLPPRPASQSPWHGSLQAPQSPPPPSHTPQQSWQQPPTPQSPWTVQHGQPSPQTPSSRWHQNGKYNRPPPPPPAELQAQHHQQQQTHAYSPSSSVVSPTEPWTPSTASPASAPVEHPQYSYQQTYYPPPQQSHGAGLSSQQSPPAQYIPQPATPTPAWPQTVKVQTEHVPQPPQFVFEMEGSIPGVPEKKQPAEDLKRVERSKEPLPEKLQRTFTDTLRQAGPYFYTPPAQSSVPEESLQKHGSDDAENESTAGALPDNISSAGAQARSRASLLHDVNSAQPGQSGREQSQNQTEQPLAGAIASCYYLKIPNPPTNIPADQSDDYFVLHECTYPDVISYADIFWFSHVDVPEFRICGFCFEKHIRRTQLACSFTGKLESKDAKLRCSFGAPWMVEDLWPQALRTADLSQVKQYMERRVRMIHCHGVNGVLGEDAYHVRWFTIRENQVPGFLACEACLEEIVISTAFQERFVPYSEAQGQDQRWACDLAAGFLRRSLANARKTGNWSTFTAAAARRLSLPRCEGENGVTAGSRNWYSPAKPIQGVVICEACYIDHLAVTQFSEDFVEYPVQGDSASNHWSCDFAPIAVKAALDASKLKSSFTPLWTTLSSLAAHPVCAAGAVANRTWYRSAAAPNFDLCPTCHAGLFAALDDLARLFAPATTPQPATRVCDLSPRGPRFAQYAPLYLAAVHTPRGLPALLAHMSRFAALPPCARRDPVRNGRWHLLHGPAADLVVCEECYAAAVEGTPLAALLAPWPPPTAGEADPVPRVCDLYSAAMRARWAALCRAYDPRDAATAPALDAFVAFARRRHRVYDETVPACRELLVAARMRTEQHRLAGAMAVHSHSMGLMSGGFGYGYGGVYAGQAAAAGAQGVGLMMEGLADERKVAMLEGRWKEVE